ncbi:MAG: thiamine phosphate synthase [Bacteroidales bacterium]
MNMLQFITHEGNGYSYFDSALLALKGGCKWIQLRMKYAHADKIREVALRLKEECQKYDAILIIDDHVDLVVDIDVDGVHLGKDDMPPHEARKLMGEKYIIGGTANTFDDIKTLVKANIDYIGLGPYRFTKTKDMLSPVLGIDGYKEIIQKYRDAGYNTPIVAIGGINKEDVSALINCGISGIAVSGTVINATDPIEETKKILEILYNVKKTE